MESGGLRPKQIKKIQTYLQSQYVHYLDVQLELVDHIAVAIESRISKDALTFEEAYRIEIKKWTWADLDAIIEKKRKSLNRFWKKKMHVYVFSFLTFPKIATLLLIYGLLVGSVLTFLPSTIFVQCTLVVLAIMFTASIVWVGYCSYDEQSWQEQFLTVEAYRKSLTHVYSLFGVGYVIMDWLPIIEFTDTYKVLILSTLIVFSGALFYATSYVFPKWLRRDVLEQYDHLSPSN